MLGFVRAQRAGRDLRAPSGAERPDWRRRLRGDDRIAALLEVDVALGTRDARVRRRTELLDQPQLLERRLELRAEDAPLDPLERAHRRLDRGPLPLGPEIRPQPRAQVARAADVEDDVAGAVEQVDAGPRRRAEGEVSLVPDASRACGGERDEICDRSRAAF